MPLMKKDSRSVYTLFERSMNDLGPFPENPLFSVAFSGGSDSLALLILLQKWIIEKGKGGQITALTVDHGLRPESKTEAENIHNWCQENQISHHILSWIGPKPETAIQKKARNTRYDLLGYWCQKNNTPYLFLGHHGNDQEETMILRQQQSTTPIGLQGMSSVRVLPWGLILRPLLNMNKENLIALLKENQLTWWEDPSNQKDIYERNRLRHYLISQSSYQGLREKKFFLPKINRGEHEKDINEWIGQKGRILWMGALSFPWDDLIDYHKKSYVLQRAITTCGGLSYPFSYSKVEKLWDHLRSKKTVYSQGRCWVWRHDNFLWICPSVTKHSPHSSIQDSESEGFLWDHRIWISSCQFKPDFLGSKGWQEIPPSLKEVLNPGKLPARLFYGLPYIKEKKTVMNWDGGNLSLGGISCVLMPPYGLGLFPWRDPNFSVHGG
jgi:tRNA(Ile)-lysidine synthetase-like protein